MYKIIIDSCGELTDSLKKDGHFCNVALELDVDGYRIRDDESFDQHDFLRRVKESVKGPKSSCPSPEDYMQAFEGRLIISMLSHFRANSAAHTTALF